MLFAPQQYVSPPVVIPHVNAGPAVIFANESVLETSVGVEVKTVPVPSWRQSLLPQQNARLSVATPQLWSAPADTARNVIPPLTATGVKLIAAFDPLPRLPQPLLPQQYALPAAVIPHVWRPY